MTGLRVYPIVEGDGEIAAVPELLRRIGFEQTEPMYIEVNTPHRIHRDQVFQETSDELAKALELGAYWPAEAGPQEARGVILVLIDADPDQEPTCVLGPRLVQRIQTLQSNVDTICVIADYEYESWFVAGASSLMELLNAPDANLGQIEANSKHHGKKWVQDRIRRGSYRETVDQVKLTNKLDLALCRRNSPSFDKLCRELEKRFQ
jgi:hypothetical protein